MADFEWLAPGGHQRLVNNVKEALAEKPDSDALSPLLTAGAALGITGNDAEKSAWLARTSDADGVESVKSIHGRTLRWNQHAPAYDSSLWEEKGNATKELVDGAIKLSTTTTSASVCRAVAVLNAVPQGHKCFISADVDTTNMTANTSVALYQTSGIGTATGGQISVSAGTAKAHYAIITDAVGENATFGVAISAAAPTTDYALFSNLQCFDLTAMFGAGSEPSTVEEFTALYPLPYYEYDAGSLLPVNMTGVETVGFNQWDEEWEQGAFNHTTGEKTANVSTIRSKNFIPVFPSTEYCAIVPGSFAAPHYYDVDKNYIGYELLNRAVGTFTTPANCRYIRFNTSITYGATYNHDICVNISDPTRNGEYAPYWQQQRTIPAGTLRSAGSVYDEQTATERIVRVGAVDLGTLTWVYDTSNARFNTYGALPDAAKTSGRIDVPCGKYTFAPEGSPDKSIFMYQGAIYVYDSAYTDAAAFKTAMSGVMAHYALATPTTTPIDLPLNMSYRTGKGGTERILVPTGEQSAPPTIVASQGYTAESLRDAALATIAPVENGRASANYGVGSYLVHGGQLCKVTTAIATGEAITIGTNVTTTTVMAEVLSLTQ